MAERFEKHARTVTLLTIASRVTGLARDAALSRVFGVGLIMDAFFFAFLIPNLFRRLFGEGALSAAFLPIYARLQQSNPDHARKVASLTMAMLIIVLGLAVILGEGVLWLISSRADHENPAIWLTMIMLPYMPMVCAVAILGAMLQVHGKFGPTAAAPMILNVLIVIAAVGLAMIVEPADHQQRLTHISVVASSVILAGVIQVAWSLFALRGHGWWTRDTAAAWPDMKRIFLLAGPMILGLGVLQLNTLFDGLIASYPTVIGPTIFGIDYPLDEGAMATVSFAQRLYQFPLGVFGIAIATAIFPLLARQSADATAFAETLRRGLRLVIYIGLPASIGLMLVREPLAAVVLQGGDFTAEDSRRVGFVLLGYAPAVWAYSMMHVLTRAYYARGNSITPVKVACSVVALNLVLNLILIWPLAEAGLAWSTAVCSIVQIVALLTLFRTSIPHLIDRNVLRSWRRTATITVIMGAIVWLVGWALMNDMMTWMESLIALAAMVCAGGFTILVASLILRLRELAWAIGSEQ